MIDGQVFGLVSLGTGDCSPVGKVTYSKEFGVRSPIDKLGTHSTSIVPSLVEYKGLTVFDISAAALYTTATDEIDVSLYWCLETPSPVYSGKPSGAHVFRSVLDCLVGYKVIRKPIATRNHSNIFCISPLQTDLFM